MAVTVVNAATIASSLPMIAKAFIQVEGQKDRLDIQFNPEQFKITRTTSYHSYGQKQQAYIEFSGLELPQLDVSFFFHTNEVHDLGEENTVKSSDVTQWTNNFMELLKVVPDLHRPPIVTFIWGSVSFQGVVKQVAVTYTMFGANGVPIEAKVDTQILGIPETGEVKVSLESPDRTKSLTVMDGGGIWRLAGTEYGDIAKWREIARANGIMNPFDIPEGTVLKVPALSD